MILERRENPDAAGFCIDRGGLETSEKGHPQVLAEVLGATAMGTETRVLSSIGYPGES